MTGSLGAETLVSDAFVVQRLTDATLAGLLAGGVHEHPAPMNTTYPFVTWQVYGPARDIGGVGPDSRIMVEVDYLIRATAEPDSAQFFKAIARRIDFLMDGATASTADGHVFDSVRREEFRLDEPIDGGTVRHVGGIYRVHAQSI